MESPGRLFSGQESRTGTEAWHSRDGKKWTRNHPYLAPLSEGAPLDPYRFGASLIFFRDTFLSVFGRNSGGDLTSSVLEAE
jgi:hypothetical protein